MKPRLREHGMLNVGRRIGPGAWLLLGVAVLAAGCGASRAFRQGNTAALNGDWDTAVTHYENAAKAEPDRADYKVALERAQMSAAQRHLERARDFESKDQLDLALAEYRRVIGYQVAHQEARAKVQLLEQTIRDRIEASRPRPPVEALRQQARKALEEPTLNPASREPLVLKFTNRQLKEILDFIGQSTGINVAYDRDFRDSAFSIDVSGISLEQALNQILTTNTLFYKVLNERTVIIIPDNQQKRLFYEEQAVQTFYVSNADPAELTTLLNSLVATQQGVRPTFAPNKGNNSITVRGSLPMLQLVEQVISMNDKPRAEISVDVEILEVNRNRAKQYGLDLSAWQIPLTFSPESRPSGTNTDTTFNLNTISAGISTADFYMAVPQAIIKFLETDSETKVLAKPNLRGSEGEKLSLKLGEEIPVPSTTFYNPYGGSGGVATSPLTSFQYKNIGVNVDLEPRVTYEGDVVMKLSFEISAKGGDVNIAGQNLPSFISRKVETRIRLRDGESNLMAGLLRETERKSLKGFPGAIHLPVLKQLFSSNDNEIQQTDIVMLITPHIVRSHEVGQKDFAPVYIGTQQNLGLAGPPPLIQRPGEPEAPPAAPTSRLPETQTQPGAVAAGTPVKGQPGVQLPPSTPVPGVIVPAPQAPTTPPPVPVPAPAQPGAVPPQTPPPAQPPAQVQPPPPTGQQAGAPAQVAPPAPPAGLPPLPKPAQPPAVPTPGATGAAAQPAKPPAAPAGAQAAPVPAAPAAAPKTDAPGRPAQAPAPDTTRVTVAPAPGPWAVAGGPYPVPILVTGAVRMSTVTLALRFDPKVLRVRLVQEGTFLRSGGGAVTFVQKVDAVAGRIDVVVTRVNDTAGSSGEGMLATVVFDAVGAGDSQLGLGGVVTSPGGTPVPVQFGTTTVTVK